MNYQGKIIEYIEQGKFICAIVLDDNGKRLKVLTQNSRELNLPLARLIHHSQAAVPAHLSRDELIRILKEADERRRALAGEIHLEEIWGMAVGEKNTTFNPRFLAELAFGQEAGDDQVAAFMRGIFTEKLYFKYKEGNLIAHSPAAVEELHARIEKEREYEALLTSGAKGLEKLWHGNGSHAFPEKDHCLRLLEEYYLFGNEGADSKIARELLKNAGLTGSHDIFHLLVKIGRWSPNENIPLRRQQLPLDFSREVEEFAREIAAQPEELLSEGRRDLRHLPVMTIDGATTRDFDDALHLEKKGNNYLVGIHVADVARYIKPGDLLFKEAMRRITSIYFPEQQIPMLPPVLSEGLCSLVVGETRAAMSFMVLLSEQGEILEYEIVPSVIEVKRQLSYPEAEARFDTDRELQDLYRLSVRLLQRRVESGALILPVPDVVVDVRRDGEVKVSLSPVDTPSRSLVAEFMVLANSLAAEFVAERQAPGLFRSQGEPHQRVVTGLPKDLFLIWRQRKQLKPGQLLTKPLPHSGVGVMQYTTVTSPIRRFLDLVMQHQIHNLLKGKGQLFDEDRMVEMAGAIDSGLARVNLVRRLRHRYWILKYLQKREGQRQEVLLINKGPKRVGVVLRDCLLEGDLPPNQAVRAKPGELVMVRLARVHPLDGVLRLEW